MSCDEQRGYYKTVNGKTYGPYWYPRKKHEWTTKDLARIAKHLKENDKIDAKEILVAVAIAVGLGAVFCKAAKAINSGLSIMSFIEKLAVILGTGVFIQVILEYLLQAKLIAPRWLNIILALAIAALSLIEKILKAINEFAQNREVIMEGATAVNELCDAVRKSTGSAITKTCDAINDDACYWAERLAEEVAEHSKSELDQAWNEATMPLWDRLVRIIEDRTIHDIPFDN